jgi:soluble lytic murein transglycosylase-like protein
MIAAHAQANGVPESLVHRVVVRESRYNPRAIGRGGAMGMMQIKTATARGVGYTGTASGLLDPNTNLTYAVRYLAGAYRVAGGNHDRAVQLYARGYYHAAKRQGVPAYAAAPGVFAAAGPDDALAARGEVARPASKRISMLTGQPDSGL